MFKLLNKIDKILNDKKITIRYTKGYKGWKKTFDKVYRETKSVPETLTKIHGNINKRSKQHADNDSMRNRRYSS